MNCSFLNIKYPYILLSKMPVLKHVSSLEYKRPSNKQRLVEKQIVSCNMERTVGLSVKRLLQSMNTLLSVTYLLISNTRIP